MITSLDAIPLHLTTHFLPLARTTLQNTKRRTLIILPPSSPPFKTSLRGVPKPALLPKLMRLKTSGSNLSTRRAIQRRWLCALTIFRPPTTRLTMTMSTCRMWTICWGGVRPRSRKVFPSRRCRRSSLRRRRSRFVNDRLKRRRNIVRNAICS